MSTKSSNFADRLRGAAAQTRTIVPGVLLALTVAAAAGFVADHYGGPVMLLALLIGMRWRSSLKDRGLRRAAHRAGPPWTVRPSMGYPTPGSLGTIVGVGGIDSPEAAYRRIRAGATLVELYTGLVYGGLGCAADIAHGLDRLLQRDGHASVADAVGTDTAR